MNEKPGQTVVKFEHIFLVSQSPAINTHSLHYYDVEINTCTCYASDDKDFRPVLAFLFLAYEEKNAVACAVRQCESVQWMYRSEDHINESKTLVFMGVPSKYRICSRNLRTFFPILAAEKSGCVKYADFFLWMSWSGFYSSIIEYTVRFVNILL